MFIQVVSSWNFLNEWKGNAVLLVHDKNYESVVNFKRCLFFSRWVLKPMTMFKEFNCLCKMRCGNSRSSVT
jgi:hypothetical protein